MVFSLEDIGLAFLGGLLIGSAALLLLFLNGRILGVSGIIGGLFNLPSRLEPWRSAFIGGLLLGGLLIRWLRPEALENSLGISTTQLILAGILVGWGTRLGSGCTSGHGVCGVSRFSPRSLIATGIFMVFGMITVRVLFSLGVFP